MNKITIISLLTLTTILSNPFKEFDKTFLYNKDNSNKNISNWSKESQNNFKSNCINTYIKEDIENFCDCALKELMNIISEDDFYVEMNSQNQDISSNFKKNIEETDCLKTFLEEISNSKPVKEKPKEKPKD